MTESDYCEMLFSTDDGRPWRLHDMPFYRTIYNVKSNRLVLKTSRQSMKTTLIRNKLAIRSMNRPGNSALYVAPTGNQVSNFSKTKLDTIFSYNKDLDAMYRTNGLDWNVMFKQFRVAGGTSNVTLRSTGGHKGAESIRGGTFNDIFKDEYQSLAEEHLAVIDECASTFAGKSAPIQAYFCNTGTPLSFQNPIEKEWSDSKGYEWCIHCPHCAHWQRPLGMHSLDVTKPFLFCTSCGKDMNITRHGLSRPPVGQWVATNPSGTYPGFRVVRLMMPWCEWRTDSRRGVLDQMERLPERKFANEVMGLPFDGGSQPITESNITVLCDSPHRLPQNDAEAAEIAEIYAAYPTFAGLDWALNSSTDTNSYTTFAVFALINGRLRMIFAKRFTGKGSDDPDAVLATLAKYMTMFSVNLLGADYGVGRFEDQRLEAMFPGRVITLHYTGAAGRVSSTYDQKGRKYMVPRTASIDELIVDIKKKLFQFPVYEDTKLYTDDWLHLTMEISDHTRTVLYRRNGPDDFVHVANYANIVKRLATGHGLVNQGVPGPAGVHTDY